ncbi:MAG: hypothetical protein CVV06_16380 [Gammaproteobacteria bacterium HGW-Gammaproteobacteria-10]|nr:MAG: hypothetical protein CVV06_16380 [Gammaproteobacteria bacterium HGW-Gammaproteobacteria-10]
MNRITQLKVSSRFAALNLSLLFAIAHFPQTADAADPDISLLEKPGDAPYSHKSITIRPAGDAAQLLVIQDSETTVCPIPYESYSAILDFLVKYEADQLEDQLAGPNFPVAPGGSRFTLSVIGDAEKYQWIADDVDNPRANSAYKKIVGHIMSITERLLNDDSIECIKRGDDDNGNDDQDEEPIR